MMMIFGGVVKQSRPSSGDRPLLPLNVRTSNSKPPTFHRIMMIILISMINWIVYHQTSPRYAFVLRVILQWHSSGEQGQRYHEFNFRVNSQYIPYDISNCHLQNVMSYFCIAWQLLDGAATQDKDKRNSSSKWMAPYDISNCQMQ